MAVSPAERQYILSQVGSLAQADLDKLWQHASQVADADFAAYVTDAFPELVDPYAAMAGDLSAVWYDESATTTAGFVAVAGPMPVREQMLSSAEWALSATGTQGLERLQGTLQRAVFDGARNTVVANVTREPGARYARHASANACAFCGMLASRGAVYTSERAAVRVVGRGKDMSPADRRARAAGLTRVNGHMAAGGQQTRGSRALGGKYHDHCHCVAIEVRPGGSYEQPEYVQKWDDAYIAATRETPSKGDFQAIDVNAVLSHMRGSLGSH